MEPAKACFEYVVRKCNPREAGMREMENEAEKEGGRDRKCLTGLATFVST